MVWELSISRWSVLRDSSFLEVTGGSICGELVCRARRVVFRRLEGERQWNGGMKTFGVRVLVGLAMIARTSGWAAVDGILGKPLPYGVPHVCYDFYRRLIYQ